MAKIKGARAFFNTNTALEMKLFVVGAEYRKIEQLRKQLIISSSIFRTILTIC